MKKSIDVKSLVIGILITVIIFLVLGAAQSTPNGSIGRFQLVSSVMSDEAFVVDTVSGQVWSDRESNQSKFYQPKSDKSSQ